HQVENVEALVEVNAIDPKDRKPTSLEGLELLAQLRLERLGFGRALEAFEHRFALHPVSVQGVRGNQLLRPPVELAHLEPQFCSGSFELARYPLESAFFLGEPHQGPSDLLQRRKARHALARILVRMR